MMMRYIVNLNIEWSDRLLCRRRDANLRRTINPVLIGATQ